jgi:hypothetical protein
MDTPILIRRLPLAAALLLGLSCAVEVGPPAPTSYYEADGVIYVREAPPPPRGEVISGIAPGPDYVWVGGYWSHTTAGWTWVPGRWLNRPRAGVVWVPGYWERHPRGHVWVAGRWR